MSFKLKVHRVKGTPVLEIFGEVTGDGIGRITSRLDALRKEECDTIAIDLSRTTFIDSHGLGAFVYCWRLLEEQNRQLVFINPQNFIRNMFNGTNLDKIFRIVDSDEAL
jgi:anti-anti-sigma factor